MIRHPRVCLEQLTATDCDAISAASLHLLEKRGLTVQCPDALRLMADCGARVDLAAQQVRLSAAQVGRWIGRAPKAFTLEARNPARSVELGADALLVAPGYGSAFVADAEGRRRPSTLADLELFARMAGHFDAIDLTGGLLVEPGDVPEPLRPLETTLALVRNSDKPFFGSVAGAVGATESLRLAEIVFGGLAGRHVLTALININSPLRLDGRMAEALLVYARAGQPILLTPGIMLGITAPVTVAGALAQALAELLGAAVLAQMANPGTPLLLGIGGFGSDLATGGSGFGRPENALGTILGAQLMRRVGLPFRCSAMVTSARSPDCRSGYERMMTAMAAWQAGAHLALQAAGTLDCINSMSFEQFLIDVEAWECVRRVAAATAVDAAHLAMEEVLRGDDDFIASEHTVLHFRDELHRPRLAGPAPYDAWRTSGSPSVVAEATKQLAELRTSLAPPLLAPAVAAELERYAAARRRALG